MGEFERVAGQALDREIEERVRAVNERLGGLFEEGDAEVTRPVVLVVGHQRSASTLVSQLLAVACDIGYPSNLVARFWRAPVAGVWMQRALGRQLGAPATDFSSDLGTTLGLLEPHEFSYFWNEWFPEPRRCRNEAAFVRLVGHLERAFAAPLAFKNVLNSLRVDVLARLLPTSLVVVPRRPLVDVACSTLDARRRRFGSDRAWFGVRPPGCAEEEMASLPPVEQIAAQLFHTEAALAEGLARVDPARVLELDYAAFCARPALLADWLADRGIARRAGATLPERFACRRPGERHPDAGALAEALRRRFRGSDLPPGLLP